MNQRFIGIMTGNSMDAADVVVMDFLARNPITHTHSHPIPTALAKRMRGLAQSTHIEISELLDVENAITTLCAQAILQINCSPNDITAIGCHGQTIAHRPAKQSTWQLLNGALLTELTGIDVICDFRRRDLATGGEGAPLVPFFHDYFFAKHRPCNIVNIGGIANVTKLSRDGTIQGWDIGPGMLLIDEWRQQQGKSICDNTLLAADTAIDTNLLNTLLQHPYLKKPAPKSCGREEFSLAQIIDTFPNTSADNIEITLIAYTAQTIVNAMDDNPVFICGGGINNRMLYQQLCQQLASPPILTDDIGLAKEYVEAAAFAWLAKMHYDKKPLNTSSVTGGKPRIAGAHYPR